jgi:uncharacterized protein YqeY
MKIEQQIEADLKQAMLSGDKDKAETLRGLKSAIHNAAIAANAQADGLSDEQIQKILASEAKKRTEAAELYQKAGETDRANKEQAEKDIIEAYLPAQLSDEELSNLVDKHIAVIKPTGLADMGKVIGAVKAEAGAAADGATVARLVKEKLQ